MSQFSPSDELTAEQRDEVRQAILEILSPAEPTNLSLAAEQVSLLKQLLGDDVCQRLGIYCIPSDFVLSVVIPVFNEAATIQKVIQRVRDTGLRMELILVDDGSTDGTRETLQQMVDRDDLKILFHEKNQGKGAALKTGFAEATGDVVVIQDADMEYDPQDFRILLQPILEDRADIVYGSRFCSFDRHVSPLWHRAANRLITNLSNFTTGLRFTDVETCYKLFRREIIQQIGPGLRERGFGIELEMTAKLAKGAKLHGWRFYERPISYDRRGYAEGKKIGWRDGIWALWCIARYRLFG